MSRKRVGAITISDVAKSLNRDPQTIRVMAQEGFFSFIRAVKPRGRTCHIYEINEDGYKEYVEGKIA